MITKVVASWAATARAGTIDTAVEELLAAAREKGGRDGHLLPR